MSKIIFTEEQKFGSTLLYLSMGAIYAVTVCIFTYALYAQFVLNEPFGNKPISDKGLILSTSLVFLVLLVSAFFLFGSKLVVIITNKKLVIIFKPLIIKPVTIVKSDINKFEIRKYKPIKEYGGWGVKQGAKKVGKAYNVRGNIGLQIYLKSGKKLLIGTERGDAILRAVKKMMESS